MVHVIFELPSFQETVDNQTTFDLATWPAQGSLTEFSISGNSTGWVAGGFSSPSGRCEIFANSDSSLQFDATIVPAFSGPGTYTTSTSDYSDTVIITDISAVPEPSALVLLSSYLLGVGQVVRKRRENSRP
jgi:hypothetical protein